MEREVSKTEDEWREQLTPEQYHVTRERGTEAPFSGEHVETTDEGTYRCVCCGNELFSSNTKYKSGTGWPSFWAPLSDERLDTEEDRRMGKERTEIVCSRCGAHLGHVFDDGPAPTHRRYCVNSAALAFESSQQEESDQ